MLNVFGPIRRTHRLLWVTIVVLTLLLTLWMATEQQLDSQGISAREVGLDSYQYAGRIDQDGTEFAGYGYLYDIQGLEPYELFSDPANASESTAHFTYYATASLTSRGVVTDPLRAIFALDSIGEITFYYQSSPSAYFANPESFANGIPIATASLHFQDILSVQGPNRGLSVGNGEFEMLTSDPFTFGYETLRFGRPGLLHQVSTFGDAVRTNATIPQSSVLLAGNAVGPKFAQTFLPAMTR